MKLTLVPVIVAAVCAAGCIHHKKTVYRDVERMKVEFENDTAGRLFYEALSKTPTHRSDRESKTDVSIPIVFSHSTETVTGRNVAFNKAVELCDTNKDGRITEQEARIFSENR
ncbi:MAG TPA: hypothetical protein DCY13_15995 [Verrucomicrobiales bacterium]|nr:hypothetical protein [Verrucomicrobiales bacterium]